MSIATYKIQDWLFQEADGKFEIDLAESGIQYHFSHDLDLKTNYHLNYSLDSGDTLLRTKIAQQYGHSIRKVLLTTGSQEALYLFYRSFLRENDHVITLTPGWQQSWEVPKIMGATITSINLADHHYKFDVDILKESVCDRTKLLILNFPHNPTGMSLSQDQLNNIITFCQSKNIFVLNDEEYLLDQQKSITNNQLSDYVGCVSSLSKIYGFPGLRLGWFVGPELIVQKMINYRRYTSVCNSHLCERLAEQVVDDFPRYIERYEKMTQSGLELLTKWASEHSDYFKLLSPQGTPFAYLCFNKPMDTKLFAQTLLETQKVLVMPAEVFEDKNAIRVSFGREKDVLQEGLNRLSKALREFQ